MGWGDRQGPDPDALLGVVPGEYACVLPGCAYSYTGPPGAETEAVLQAHLDAEHTGWTVEELRRQVRRSQGYGP